MSDIYKATKEQVEADIQRLNRSLQEAAALGISITIDMDLHRVHCQKVHPVQFKLHKAILNL